MTFDDYLAIFKRYTEPIWREHKRLGLPFILEEDNDGSHGTRSTYNIVHKYKTELEKEGFKYCANCPQYPDFSIN